MICYDNLFDLMKIKGKTKKDIRNEKIIGQETLRKLRYGTGIYENYDYYASHAIVNKDNEVEIEKAKEQKKRISSIDSKSIEALCTWLNCQPNDIMRVIPNKWEYADELRKQFNNCTDSELSNYLPMPPKE